MSNDQVMEMNKVIGQIEDELRDIKSAKEQAEAVIGSNKALSDSLQILFDSASNVAKALENNTLQIVADINNKIEMLNIQASDIDRYAQQGVSKISEQSALAQSKLEDELGNLVQKLVGTISTSMNQSVDVVGNELAGYRVLIYEAAQKFTDSTSDSITKQEGQIAEIGELVACISEQTALTQSKLEFELGNLVQQLMGTISTSTNQNLEAVGNELAKHRILVHEAAQKFTDSTSDAITKQEGQIAEIGKLIACIQERQYALELKIEELRQLDIVRLFDEVSEIRKIESENTTATKKWRVVELSALAVCIVLGIAVLIKLLVM